VDCGGTSICERNRVRSRCKDCGGVSLCEHNRRRSECKDCGGTSICEHNRVRSACKDCGGVSICEHSRQRSACKDCGGASICEHNRVRSVCVGCGGLGAPPSASTADRGARARTASDARLSLPPPGGSCNRMLGVHALAPHDTSRASARGSCGRHRRSPLRPRSTHTPAMPSDATGGWPCLHPSPRASPRAHTVPHTTAHTAHERHTQTHTD
jgi:hypothetical protein